MAEREKVDMFLGVEQVSQIYSSSFGWAALLFIWPGETSIPKDFMIGTG